MEVLIAVFGLLTTAMTVGGMILMAPGGAEQDAPTPIVSETPVVPAVVVPVPT